ncbi:MAG: NAD(P)-dependent oxidoreductase [Planctomycetes bacterium]|nr:NAD(P)-dependent oxidoreductase [Planctomycetota bacterium]
MKTLVTGAGGYLGRGLIVPFEGRHDLRLMDVVPFESPHEVLVGSVADLETCRKAVAGCDAMVIAHMASRQAGSYDTPVAPFDVNVKGTANLFFAAVEAGIRKVVLISSIGAVGYHQRKGTFLTIDLPPRSGGDQYSLTKICQEVIAREYHDNHGVAVAVLRPAYITDADSCKDKYGKEAHECNWQFIDRRDIGLAARLALELPDLGYEIFYTLGTPMAKERAEMAPIYERLGWKPQHPFVDKLKAT